MNDSSILSCHQLTKTFSEGNLNVDVLKGINLSIEAGQTVAIIGASGSGKSTLLHLLGGLDIPSSGEVSLCGHELSSLSEQKRGELRNRLMGFIYQFHHLLPEFTALENVTLPLVMGGVAINVANEQARDMLGKVGLAERTLHKPGEMSGGERQRAAIARAMVTHPKCLLADEPTGNLDETTAEQVFDLMIDLNRTLDTSLVMVTHNHKLAEKTDQIYRIKEGQLIQGG